MNGSGYQEEGQSKESNRICNENEKSTKGSRSSIKKSAGRDEAIDRQRKTRSRRVEEGRESDVKYKKLSIQRKTSKEVDGEI